MSRRSERLRAAREKGTHTPGEWEDVVRECSGRCVRCGMKPPRRPEKDHIVPIYQGGSDMIQNLQPVCAWCNSSKGPERINWLAFRRRHGWEETIH